jgi:hypothetical protein
LLILSLVLLEIGVLVFLNDFDSSMLYRFANEHLQNGLNLILVIEEVGIALKYLSCLCFTLSIWYENRRRWSINEIVGRNFGFRNEVVAVAELLPVIGPRHLLHLYVLLLFLLSLALPLPFLDEATLTHLFLSLFHVCLFHPLFFD